MVQSPDTKRRKAREKMARYRAKQSTEQKEETRRRNALQQKACRVNWTAGRKAKEKWGPNLIFGGLNSSISILRMAILFSNGQMTLMEMSIAQIFSLAQ